MKLFGFFFGLLESTQGQTLQKYYRDQYDLDMLEKSDFYMFDQISTMEIQRNESVANVLLLIFTSWMGVVLYYLAL